MNAKEISAMKEFVYECAGEELKFPKIKKQIRESACRQYLILKFASAFHIPWPDAPAEWLTLKKKFFIYYKSSLAAACFLKVEPEDRQEVEKFIPLVIEEEDIFLDHMAAAFRKKVFGNLSLRKLADWIHTHTTTKNQWATIYNKLRARV